MNTKADNLKAYVNGMKSKLTSPVPAKHVNREEAYRAFLEREIRTHQVKIDDLKLAVEPPKK